MTGPLTCRDFIDTIDDYVGQTLDAAQRAPFDAHVAACAGCRDYLKTYRDTVQLGKALGGDSQQADDPPTQQMPERWVKAILAARKT